MSTATQDSRPGLLHDKERLERLLTRQAPWFISGAVHLSIMLVFLGLAWKTTGALVVPENVIIDVKADDAELPKHDFTNEDVGLDPSRQLNYKVDRIEDVSVPGVLRPEEAVGLDGAPPAAATNVPPPPGISGGAGGGINDPAGAGTGNMFGDPGGFLGGRLAPGEVFGGRSGATREKMVAEGGGNAASEAAVARGLKWLQRQQLKSGQWNMIEGSSQDDMAATGLALLPFLAAGATHRPAPGEKLNLEYVKTVDAGLKYLVEHQAANGLLATDRFFKHYSHAICTMALCEAYGMTNDPALRRPAQKALDYLIKAQHSAGGFRYEVAQPGDVSVTGWCLQAMHSGKLAGLSIAPESFVKVSSFLDSKQSKNGAAYGYTRATDSGNMNMSAVGLLCRAYLGWGAKNPNMMAGVDGLKGKLPPTAGRTDMYYYYYATQVMHFCAAPNDWDTVWNPRMRDYLITTQDNSSGEKRGSWAPDDSQTGAAGGRMSTTCLSLLTLEVYYRYLPLNRRENSGRNILE